jgi:hypothetical protein
MTIEKDRVIRIPIWFVSIILPLIIAIITSYGMMTSKAATQDAKIQNIEKQLDNKADLKDCQYIKETLNDIRTDLKKHMDENKK